MAAQHESTELRGQALKDIKNILTRVEGMRAAVTEEMESQRILTNVAKLRAGSNGILAESTGGLSEVTSLWPRPNKTA